ncbi:MAG: ABC transporter substrate-binding protein, partial [Planctomycetota bacterium]
ELDPNQRGLKRFVELVTDRMIDSHLTTRNFKAARAVLDLLNQSFAELGVANIATWQAKFEQGASRQLNIARRAVDREEYSQARQALRRALDILPDASGAREMMAEIERKSPQLVVAVDQLPAESPLPLSVEARRIDQLTNPRLVSLVGFGAEGGDYASPWGQLTSDDTGLELDLELNETAMERGLSADVVALELLRRADPHHDQFRVDFATLLRDVEILRGTQVRIQWVRSHVRPESLLELSLRDLGSVGGPEVGYLASRSNDQSNAVTYRPASTDQPGPKTIIETYYENEEVAFAELLSGEVDVIARLPPWQVLRIQQTPGVAVAPYRLPIVHVLIPNYENPLMGRREFRRAICYGVDRQQILNDILLGGDLKAGFRVLSAPMPAGVTITDPVGYAYNQGRQPRTYEPRLAAVLAAVARNSLAKIEAIKKGKVPKGSDDNAGAVDAKAKPTIKVEPLVIAHPTSPAAIAACQTIKLQLGAIGIPVQLARIESNDQLPAKYDLLYAELAIWEPIVDARRLLGPSGLAGRCSSPMSLALTDVDRANNWKEVRARLREVHEIAFNDLPVIPLWQTLDYLAHREALDGIGTTPVALYQNVAQWRRNIRGGRR